MAAERTTRAWPWVIAILAIALVAVLALGAWATWRPLSDDDAARLNARDLVTSVAESSRDGVPQETTERQLSALGPEATPAQRARINEMGSTSSASRAATGPAAPAARDSVSAEDNLTTAVSRMTELALEQEDPELAATMAGIAASWSANIIRQNPDAPPLMRTEASGETPTPDTHSQEVDAQAAERCTPELTAVATQVDRAVFTAQSAEARGTNSQSIGRALNEWQESLQRIQDQPTVGALYECEPRPARGGYQLPRDLAENPQAAMGDVAHDVSAYSQSVISTVTPAERAWLLDVLESSTRAQSLLRPSDPVPALAGEIQISGR